jgi:ankyrin repeat protein
MTLALHADTHNYLKEQLAKCSERGDVNSVLQILEAGPDQVLAALGPDGTSALHLAVRGGQLSLTRLLIEQRANPNAADSSDGRMPLHLACLDYSEEIALELLVAKADPDAQDKLCKTPLHYAVKGTNLALVKVLVEHGKSTVTIGDEVGNTPLMVAAENGRADIVTYLCARDASSVSQQNAHGWTAMHIASHGAQMRAAPSSHANHRKFERVLQALIDSKADPDYTNCTDMDKKTPLHRAATTGNAATLEVLLRGGANVNAADQHRWMPLHYACQEGHLAVARLLLSWKAQVQPPQGVNPECLMPLAVATMENHTKVCQILMEHNADPQLRGKGLASAIMIARQDKVKHDDILGLFELGLNQPCRP